MNGPEHYAKAETLLTNLRAELPSGGLLRTLDQRMEMLAWAQVHATLAHAAATIETAASRGPGDIQSAWTAICEVSA